MIVRIWHGQTARDKADRYEEVLLHAGTKDYRDTAGNESIRVWRQDHEKHSDFWTVTEWVDEPSIHAFAGDDASKARYYPVDDEYLLEKEPKVQHYRSMNVSNRESNTYRRQFEEMVSGESWLAESFAEKLGSINSQQAFQVAIPGLHCIAEVLWHCYYWRTVFLEAVKGNIAYRTETMDELNFISIPLLHEKGWDQLQQLFWQSQQAILSFLESTDDRFWTTNYRDTENFGHLAEGIIHHDVYHLGQIGLLIKIIRLQQAQPS